MQALRWLVAGFIILNAVSGGLLALRAVVIKRRARIEPGMPAVNALLASIPGPLVGLWLASMTLFLASALLLVLVEPAAVAVFILALALNLVVVRKAHAAIYGRRSNAGALLTSCIVFGMLFFAGIGRSASAAEPSIVAPSPRAPAGERLEVHRHLPR